VPLQRRKPKAKKIEEGSGISARPLLKRFAPRHKTGLQFLWMFLIVAISTVKELNP